MTETKKGRRLSLLTGIILLIPSILFAAPVFRVDMDAAKPGLQTEIRANPGDTFTSNIEVLLNDNSESLSSFGFSLWWDAAELAAPPAGSIRTSTLAGSWTDLSYSTIDPSYIRNISQLTFDWTEGLYTGIVATVDWSVLSPSTDGALDINLGYFSEADEVYDKNGAYMTPVFEGGSISVAPEPASALLFLSGGALLAFRRYLNKLGFADKGCRV